MADFENNSQWIEAAEKEIISLEKRALGLKWTWLMHKQRFYLELGFSVEKEHHQRVVHKFEARYCVRGDLQEGDFNTYAPIVAWSTVRLFLVVSLTLDYYTCSVVLDFSNAFVPATLYEPVWIHLPSGFNLSCPSRTCLRLCRSLYGLSFAPKQALI